ncbi:MAG: hypothetical protein HGA65_08705 [Oscillochloris sp.]|nr:hypothetical protein [Oscillochloris sp.]
MSEPFPRTTRYLTADGGGLALAGTLLGLLIAALWLGWSFLARVPVYVQAQSIQLEANHVYRATVDPIAAVPLTPGQQVMLQLAVDPAEDTAPSLLAATIKAVDPSVGQIRIELDTHTTLPAEARGWMITEHVSPATLIARAVEQTFTSP